MAACKKPEIPTKDGRECREAAERVIIAQGKSAFTVFACSKCSFFFFLGMSLCQVEQRKLPQLQAATSVAVLALCRRIPLDPPALFLRRHNQREKKILL